MLDGTQLQALVAAHGKWLLVFLRSLLGDAAEADDAFQDVWLRLARSSEPFRGSGEKAYLAKLARSVAIDRFRRSHPTESLDVRDDATGAAPVETLADGAPTPSEAFESGATAADVRAAVARLPVNQRQVVLMRIEGEMEFREIAEELNVPLGTALTWMRKAVQTLKRDLGEEK